MLLCFLSVGDPSSHLREYLKFEICCLSNCKYELWLVHFNGSNCVCLVLKENVCLENVFHENKGFLLIFMFGT